MATGTTAQQTVDVVTPAAGESVAEGTILEWHAKVGDFIKVDDTIVEISTDKVDLELPSPDQSVLSPSEVLAASTYLLHLAQGDLTYDVNGQKIGGRQKGETPEEGAKAIHPHVDLKDGDKIKIKGQS